MRRGATDRFARAGKGLREAMTIDGAFAVLDRVAQPTTRWSIVYDIRNRAITWRTAVNRNRRSIKFSTLDFSCATPVRVADIDGGPFRDYTRAENLALVRRSITNTSFLRDTPNAEIEEAAAWPDTHSACQRSVSSRPRPSG